MPATVYSYAESQDVADSLAKYILDIQTRALAIAPTFKIAISGGSLGKVLKKGLIDNEAMARQIQWAKWEVSFSDERLVALDHEDSNYGLFNEMVLSALKAKSITAPKVYTIDESLLKGENGQVSEGTEAADSQIAEQYALQLPASFDLVLLGCGPDGHTCSLFPGHALLNERSVKIANISDSPKPPPRRITFTFPVLEAAKNIAFVAEGAGKAGILGEIFGAKDSGLPSEQVNKIQVPVSWFVGDSAVAGVPVLTSKY
ncbi:hypothetical protein BABINDRAFT_160821 [Babjeviella inositovora NRRL Y-12698]|uniref:6-phosphogluconolactonase-like protein n=1 Tax=Babjeviella inositovora NRRL Y-12698 TaxID=984486 RepID=A0A1E3QS69_9ASCO|nr:uncharacterized protein BABINDRAFT_160821 [Babjeviella inositovora NRRL Y-12698]ODQ80556.1 hypothetical protein BABINDRAFT_160821 [Babjeviella inositovora NRRL Y-12698]